MHNCMSMIIVLVQIYAKLFRICIFCKTDTYRTEAVLLFTKEIMQNYQHIMHLWLARDVWCCAN